VLLASIPEVNSPFRKAAPRISIHLGDTCRLFDVESAQRGKAASKTSGDGALTVRQLLDRAAKSLGVAESATLEPGVEGAIRSTIGNAYL
jgi:hypothetical protein